MDRNPSIPVSSAAGELEYDLVVSSGGPAAVLCGVGTLFACDLAGIKFRRLGGVSGGAIATAYSSCGVPARELVALSLNSEFGANLNPEQGLLRMIRKLRRKQQLADPNQSVGSSIAASFEDGCGCVGVECKSRPRTGLYGSEPLGRYIDKLIRRRVGANDEEFWPANYWTMATTKDGGQVVIDADGVTLFSTSGERLVLSDKPMSLGTAVRASCTIPGILAALEYKGMLLFDGALSRDGICPVGVQIRHYGADPKRIIACRVNEDALTPVSGRLHRLARRLWRVHPDFSWGEETAGVIEFRPLVDHVHTLKFHLSRDEKWLAIMVAFESCLSTLALRGILRGDALNTAQSVFESLGFWRDAHPREVGEPQVLTQRIEACLSEHGLF